MNTQFFIVLIILTSLVWTSCDKDAQNSSTTVNTTINKTGNEAIDGLSEKIVASPSDPALYNERAQLFYEKEGYDEAIQDWTKAIRLDSTNASYYHSLGDAYLDYSRSRLALKTMEQAGKQFPTSIPTLLKLAEFQFILRKHQESLKTIDQVLRMDPQSARGFFFLGMNLKEMNQEERAINSFQTAVENDPDLIDAWLNLGRMFAERKNKVAEQYFDSAIRVDSTSIEALHSKAIYLANTKDDLDGALELYRKIATVDENYEEAYFNSGLLYLDKNEIEAAYEQFDLTVKASPTHIKGHYYRGLAAELNGDFEMARKDYEKALQMYPAYEDAQNRLNNLK